MSMNPLNKIMNPASISIAGASNDFRKMGTIQLLNLKHGGYRGEIMPVHPKEKQVLGLKAYPSINDLPHAPELAILVVPTPLVPPMLDEFGRIGTRHAVIITAGFRETGGDGQTLEGQIIEIARSHGIRFLGPNCLGIVNAHLPLNITVAPSMDGAGTFSIASQSGTYIAQSVNFLKKNGILLGKAISVGNEASIDISDCIEYLGEDDDTRAIGLYVEGLRDAARFLETARRVSRKKPIVAQYVGGTEAGARSGSSHTGAMAGPDFIYEGLFRQAGIIRAATIEEVYRLGWALANQPPLKGPRIAVLTNSGGPGTAIATTCNNHGLDVPEFSEEIQESVGQFLPGHASARNPVDLTFHIDMETLTVKIPEVLFQADEIDGVIIHGIMDTGFRELLFPALKEYYPISYEDFMKISEIDLGALLAMPGKFGKPLMATSFFGREDHCVRLFHENRVPVFDSPEKAARAMAALHEHHLFIKRSPNGSPGPLGHGVPEGARDILDGRRGVIDEYHAKKVLTLSGIPTPKELLVSSIEEAEAGGDGIGFPVAVKACSPDISHKTEQSLVHLNVRDRKGLSTACRSILKTAPGTGILVAEMLSGTREFMAGISTHQGFPPCVMFGIGGVFAEALKDFTIRLAPLTKEDALDMIGSLRSRALLGPFRGMEEADRDALADLLVRLGTMALDFPSIREVDLNPVIIVRGRPVVADALMIMK